MQTLPQTSDVMGGPVVQPSPRRYAQRKQAKRLVASRRIAATLRTPLTAAQRAHDPLLRPERTRLGQLARALVAAVSAAALHATIIGVAVWLGGTTPPPEPTRRVAVTLRKPPPLPKVAEPPPEEVAVDEPAVSRVEKAPVPTEAKEPPPRKPPPAKAPEPAPAEPIKKPPPRIVGIDLSSTAAGGDGPSFAVGNTREGRTAEKAADAKKVTPGATGPIREDVPEEPASPNRAASRIPTAGAQYSMPKRKRPSTPPYPELLKRQGVEADVTVMVNVDAKGFVTSVKLIREAPQAEFNEAARKAALAEVFEPATKDGMAIPYSLSFTYRFRLGDP